MGGVGEEELEAAFGELYRDANSEEVQDVEHSSGDTSLRIDWEDLAEVHPDVAQFTLRNPDSAQSAAERILADTIQRTESNIHARFNNLPEDRALRVSDVRTSHLGEMVSITGKVVEAEKVQPLLIEGCFTCQQCGTRTFKPQDYGDIIEPTECLGCEGSNGFSVNQEHSTIIDYRCVIIKSTNTNIEDPPVMPVYLLNDLVEVVGEGDEVVVVGSYQIHPMSRQREVELNTYVEAIDIDVEEHAEVDSVEPEKLTAYIYDAVNKLMETKNSFGATREDVEQHVHEEHGVRRKEIETRIDDLVEDDSEDLNQQAGQLIK